MNTQKISATNDTTDNSIDNASVASDLDAGAMLKDYLRDQRIERILNGGSPRKTRKVTKARKTGATSIELSQPDTLEAETGWSREDAIAMALECRSDRNRYGAEQLYV